MQPITFLCHVRKTSILALLFVMSVLTSFGANNAISVKKFQLLEKDQTALQGNVRDNNSKRCALIIIRGVPDNVDLKCDVGSAWSKLEQKRDENNKKVYLLWLSEKTPRINRLYTSDPAIKPLEKYTLSPTVESGKTYEMTLNQVLSGEDIARGGTYLIVEVSPQNARVEVDDVPWSVSDGIAQRPIEFGKHTIRVSAPNYHTDILEINVQSAGNQTQKVSLVPAFGWLEIRGNEDVAGAEIYVDGEKIGTGQMRSGNIPSGTHKLKVTKELYKMFEVDFTITDNNVTVITPAMKANFATTTLKTIDEVEIWVDGKKVSSHGSWRGKLEKGKHRVECRRPGYETTQEIVSVDDISKNYVFDLPLPQPRYGAISIESTPRECDVEIDGKIVGKTPYYSTKILMGTHNIKLIPKQGSAFQPYTETVNISEGSTTNVNAKLTDITSATINYSPDFARVEVDGKIYSGSSPVVITGSSGEKHHIYVGAYKYTRKQRDIVLGKDKKINITLHEYKTKRNEFYTEFGWNLGASAGPIFTMGFNDSGCNGEAFFSLGLGAKETLYIATGEYGNEDNVYPYPFDYSLSWTTGGKIGYTWRLGTICKLTPQIGVRLCEISESYYYSGNTYCLSGTLGLRFYLAFSHWVGLSFNPEYAFGVKKPDGYKTLAEMSSKIKSFAEGFTLRTAFTITF